jgi:D-ribose pyranose/furanose isomerase RbsD
VENTPFGLLAGRRVPYSRRPDTVSASGWLDTRADALGERHQTSHEQLEAMLPGVGLAVRTGEETPCANVVLE